MPMLGKPLPADWPSLPLSPLCLLSHPILFCFVECQHRLPGLYLCKSLPLDLASIKVFFFAIKHVHLCLFIIRHFFFFLEISYLRLSLFALIFLAHNFLIIFAVLVYTLSIETSQALNKRTSKYVRGLLNFVVVHCIPLLTKNCNCLFSYF